MSTSTRQSVQPAPLFGELPLRSGERSSLGDVEQPCRCLDLVVADGVRYG